MPPVLESVTFSLGRVGFGPSRTSDGVTVQGPVTGSLYRDQGPVTSEYCPGWSSPRRANMQELRRARGGRWLYVSLSTFQPPVGKSDTICLLCAHGPADGTRTIHMVRRAPIYEITKSPPVSMCDRSIRSRRTIG